VPEAAGTSGIHRTTTVNPGELLSWMMAPDLGVCKAEKVHGMQGVRGCHHPLPPSGRE
jgi:hypothetical protein